MANIKQITANGTTYNIVPNNTDTSSKIYLLGATSQSSGTSTYTDNEVYVTSGALVTKTTKVGGDSGVNLEFDSTNKCLNFVFS